MTEAEINAFLGGEYRDVGSSPEQFLAGIAMYIEPSISADAVVADYLEIDPQTVVGWRTDSVNLTRRSFARIVLGFGLSVSEAKQILPSHLTDIDISAEVKQLVKQLKSSNNRQQRGLIVKGRVERIRQTGDLNESYIDLVRSVACAHGIDPDTILLENEV